MKKVLSLILCAVLLMVPLAPCVAAETEPEVQHNSEIEYFEDGSFLVVVTMGEEEKTMSANFLQKLLNLMKKLIALLFPNQQMSVSKTKHAEYYDANKNCLWSIHLSAEFTYNGKTAECAKASISYKIYDSDWKLVSSSCAKNGAAATGSFSFRQYKLGVPLKLIEKTLTLVCNKDGKVS